jgi:hypothetical protein
VTSMPARAARVGGLRGSRALRWLTGSRRPSSRLADHRRACAPTAARVPAGSVVASGRRAHGQGSLPRHMTPRIRGRSRGCAVPPAARGHAPRRLTGPPDCRPSGVRRRTTPAAIAGSRRPRALPRPPGCVCAGSPARRAPYHQPSASTTSGLCHSHAQAPGPDQSRRRLASASGHRPRMFLHGIRVRSATSTRAKTTWTLPSWGLWCRGDARHDTTTQPRRAQCTRVVWGKATRHGCHSTGRKALSWWSFGRDGTTGCMRVTRLLFV